MILVFRNPRSITPSTMTNPGQCNSKCVKKNNDYFTALVQQGSKYQPFEYLKHLNIKLFEVRYSNDRFFNLLFYQGETHCKLSFQALSKTHHFNPIIHKVGWALQHPENSIIGNMRISPLMKYGHTRLIRGLMLIFPFPFPSCSVTGRHSLIRQLASPLSPNMNCTHYDVTTQCFCRGG